MFEAMTGMELGEQDLESDQLLQDGKFWKTLRRIER